MGSTLNNRSTITEQHTKNRQQAKPQVGLNACYWRQIFALDSVVVKTQKYLARMDLKHIWT